MASKPKRSKTYIVLQLSTGGRFRVVGRYRVGAKNGKQAKDFLRKKIGKHTKVHLYYEDKRHPVPFGVVEVDMRVGMGYMP